MQNPVTFIPPDETSFTRAGSDFLLQVRGSGDFGYARVFLASGHGGAALSKMPAQLQVDLIVDGETVPYAVGSSESVFTLYSDWGSVSFCLGEVNLLQFRGTPGIGLRFSGPLNSHEMAKDMLDGSWQIGWTYVGSWRLAATDGQLAMNAPYDFRKTQTLSVRADFAAGPGQVVAGVIEAFEGESALREAYPTFDTGAADAQADFEQFLTQAVGPVAGISETNRRRAAWTTWSHIMLPSRYGLVRRPMIRMLQDPRLCMAFGWQQSYQAMTLARDVDLAWDLLLSIFDFQRDDGQLPDNVTAFAANYNSTKPPLQGVAICWLLDHADVSAIGREKIAQLYQALARYHGWWFATHDNDCDGMPEYQHADESGWDDNSLFVQGLPIESPDLAAYLVMIEEALGRLAGLFGDEDAELAWLDRSRALLAEAIGQFWNGERFVARKSGSHEIVATDSICFFQPLLLGKRLPERIRETLIAKLMREGEYLTPSGFASESLKSRLFAGGWMLGGLSSPVQFLLGLALEACGHHEHAAELARRYCGRQERDGFYHMANSVSGRNLPGLNFPWSSWGSSTYLFLAQNCLTDQAKE
jgi:putative isomerase